MERRGKGTESHRHSSWNRKTPPRGDCFSVVFIDWSKCSRRPFFTSHGPEPILSSHLHQEAVDQTQNTSPHIQISNSCAQTSGSWQKAKSKGIQIHRFAKANSRTNRKSPNKDENARGEKKKKLAETYTNIWSYKVKETRVCKRLMKQEMKDELKYQNMKRDGGSSRSENNWGEN